MQISVLGAFFSGYLSCLFQFGILVCVRKRGLLKSMTLAVANEDLQVTNMESHC